MPETPRTNIDDLLGDLDAFSKKLDADQEQMKQSAEQEAQRKAQEQARLDAERRRLLELSQPTPNKPLDLTSTMPPRRPSALDMLKKQSEAMPRAEDIAKARQKIIDTLDAELRSTATYVAAVGEQINQVSPAASGPYEFQWMGKVNVSLSGSWISSRPRRIEGRDYLEHIIVRYMVNPLPPHQLRLLGPDIERYSSYLMPMKPDYEMQVEQKNDFGQPTRANFVIKGKLPCQIEIKADYDNLKVDFELYNVRKPGRVQCRIEAGDFKEVADDLARYMLGVDNDFEKVLQRGAAPKQ